MKSKKKQWRVYCADGPCKGQVFTIKPNSDKLIIVTPENPFYTEARYSITDEKTAIGEFIAFNTFNVKRKK